jgi:hypothetical protein
LGSGKIAQFRLTGFADGFCRNEIAQRQRAADEKR